MCSKLEFPNCLSKIDQRQVEDEERCFPCEDPSEFFCLVGLQDPVVLGCLPELVPEDDEVLAGGAGVAWYLHWVELDGRVIK